MNFQLNGVAVALLALLERGQALLDLLEVGEVVGETTLRCTTETWLSQEACTGCARVRSSVSAPPSGRMSSRATSVPGA